MTKYFKLLSKIIILIFLCCGNELEIKKFIGSKYKINTEITFKNVNYKKENFILDNIVYDGLSKNYVRVSKNNIFDQYSKNNFYNLYRNEDLDEFHLYSLDYLKITNDKYMIASVYKCLQNDKANLVVVFIYFNRAIGIQDVIEVKVIDLFPELYRMDNGSIILSLCHKDGTDWFSFYKYNNISNRFLKIENE